MPDLQIEARFPLAGIDQSDAFSKQKPKALPSGEYARTTADATNVRGYDVLDRFRGGSRPGLVKYVAQAVGGIEDWIVQELNVVVIVE